MSSQHEIVTSLPFWRTVGKALAIMFAPAALGALVGHVGRLAFGMTRMHGALLTMGGLFAGLIIMLVWLTMASKRSPGGPSHGLPNMTTVPLLVEDQGLSGTLTLSWSDIAAVQFIEPMQSITFEGSTARQVQGRSLVPKWGAIGIEDKGGATHLLSAAGVDKNKALFEALEKGLAASKG